MKLEKKNIAKIGERKEKGNAKKCQGAGRAGLRYNT